METSTRPAVWCHIGKRRQAESCLKREEETSFSTCGRGEGRDTFSKQPDVPVTHYQEVKHSFPGCWFKRSIEFRLCKKRQVDLQDWDIYSFLSQRWGFKSTINTVRPRQRLRLFVMKLLGFAVKLQDHQSAWERNTLPSVRGLWLLQQQNDPKHAESSQE